MLNLKTSGATPVYIRLLGEVKGVNTTILFQNKTLLRIVGMEGAGHSKEN